MCVKQGAYTTSCGVKEIVNKLLLKKWKQITTEIKSMTKKQREEKNLKFKLKTFLLKLRLI